MRAFVGVAIIALALVGVVYAGVTVGPVSSPLGLHLAQAIAAAKGGAL